MLAAEPGLDFRPDDLVFIWDKKVYNPRYDQITSLEYGQGVTTLGLLALPVLLSKKRKHIAAIGYKDDLGKPQALILEFGKDLNRAAMKTMSLKSGVAIEFESKPAEDEFRHNKRGGFAIHGRGHAGVAASESRRPNRPASGLDINP